MSDSSTPQTVLNDAFFMVVKQKDYARAAELLNQGADVNASHTRRGGITPLLEAIDDGAFDTARWLLDSGADPDRHKPSATYPPLHAILELPSDRRAAWLALMLEYQPDLEIKSPNGSTPVQRAIDCKDEKTALRLIAAGAKTHLERDGDPLWYEAVCHGLEAVSLLLLEREVCENGVYQPALEEKQKFHPLRSTVRNGLGKTACFLVRAGAPVAEDIFLHGVISDTVGALPELLAHGFDLETHCRGNTALTHAAHMGCGEAFTYLLECGADIAPTGTPSIADLIAKALAHPPHRPKGLAMEKIFTDARMFARADEFMLLNEIGAKPDRNHPDYRDALHSDLREDSPRCFFDSEGRASIELLRVASQRRLRVFFTPDVWQDDSDKALAFHRTLKEALPPHYRPQMDDIDMVWTKANSHLTQVAARRQTKSLPTHRR